MYAPHEQLEQQLDEQRDEQEPEAETDHRGNGERAHAAKPDPAAGRPSGPGRLFVLELVAVQLAWIGLLAFGLWRLID